ncbi:MAG: SMI1/KNR4 family protein [Planctomycetes bacterium]|nr:SMI1/KNR4 family protein [Planctomycetota bacterium]
MEPSAYLEHLGRGADIEHVDASFLDWVASIGAGPKSVACFAAGWVGAGGMVGTGFPMAASEIAVLAEAEPRWLASGFLIIGSCGNGDPVALDLRDAPGAVCFLSHDVLWPDEHADPRAWSVQVAADLAEFVGCAWDLDAFPVDFCDARSDDGEASDGTARRS